MYVAEWNHKEVPTLSLTIPTLSYISPSFGSNILQSHQHRRKMKVDIKKCSKRHNVLVFFQKILLFYFKNTLKHALPENFKTRNLILINGADGQKKPQTNSTKNMFSKTFNIFHPFLQILYYFSFLSLVFFSLCHFYHS